MFHYNFGKCKPICGFFHREIPEETYYVRQ